MNKIEVSAARRKTSGVSNKIKQTSISYAMLSPLIIGFCVFTIYPILWAARLSFFSYDGIPSHTFFVGIKNYINAFINDKAYWSALLNSFIFMAIKMPIEMPLALIIAVLLNRKMKGRNAFRALYYMPTIIGVAIVGLVFSNMFGYFGVMNSALQGLRIIKEPIDWFANKGAAMMTLVVASLWNSIGLNIVYFLAAIQDVPKELYEAAAIDGAGPVRAFWSITIPSIAPVMQIVIMLGLVGSLKLNDLVLVLTGGAPSGQTFTVMSYIVNKYVPSFAADQTNIGYGCALALITAVVMALFTAVYMKTSGRTGALKETGGKSK